MNEGLSIFLSFSLSRRSLGMGPLVLFEFWHAAGNPYEIVHDRAGLFRKTFFARKIEEMGQK